MTSASKSTAVDEGGVRGVLHAVPGGASRGLVLTHGAGGDCDAPLLVALAEAFWRSGVAVLRCDLPFRQRRPKGPPSPATAEADRAGLQAAVAFMRARSPEVWLGGHSYGGRQASILAAGANAHRPIACCCCPIPCIRRTNRISREPATSPICELPRCSSTDPETPSDRSTR